MKFRYLILFCLLSGTVTNVFTQETSLERFTASEVRSRVYLEWIIKSGNTCQGIRILRSMDSINFIQIGDIGGVCGNISSPQAYNFTDENPVKNKINYYRLELGGIGLSKIVSVEIIDLQSGGFQIRPNPITSQARIYFVNTSNRNTQLNIYNLNGSEIFHTQSINNYFIIPVGSLQFGTYVFTISTPGSLPFARGKLIVLY